MAHTFFTRLALDGILWRRTIWPVKFAGLSRLGVQWRTGMFPALRMVVNGCVDPACFCGPLTVRVGTWSQDVEEWTPALSTGFTKGTFPPLSYNMKKKEEQDYLLFLILLHSTSSGETNVAAEGVWLFIFCIFRIKQCFKPKPWWNLKFGTKFFATI